MLFYYLTLFLGACVLDCKARNSFNAPERSRIVMITDFLNSSDGEKVSSSLENKNLADVDLVVLQRDGPSSFHGSVILLSRRKKRALWQVTDKELLPWLLLEKPSTLISVTHSTDIPKVLISARRKGLLLFTKELVIWIIQGSTAAVGGTNGIILTSPGDLDSQSTFVDANHLISKKVQLLSARDFENAVVEVLQRRKLNLPRRQRRAVTASNSSNATMSGENSTLSTVFSSIANQMTVSPSVTYIIQPSHTFSVYVSSNTAPSTIADQPAPGPNVSSSVAALTYSSSIAMQPTPTANASATNSSAAALSTSSEVVVQSMSSPTVYAINSSIATLAHSSSFAMQPTLSPHVSATNSNIAAWSTSLRVAMRSTSSPSVHAVSSGIAVSTSSSEIAGQTTPSPNVSAMGSSVAASVASSGVKQTQSPNISVTTASVSASSFNLVVNTTQSEMKTMVVLLPSSSLFASKPLNLNMSVMAQSSSSSLTSLTVGISLSSAVITTAPVLPSSSIGTSSALVVTTAVVRPLGNESTSSSFMVASSFKIVSIGVSSTEIPSHSASKTLSSFAVFSSFLSTQPSLMSSQASGSPSALVSSSTPSSLSLVGSQVSTSSLFVKPTSVFQLSSAVVLISSVASSEASPSSTVVSSFTSSTPSLLSSQPAASTPAPISSSAPSSLIVVQSYVSTSTALVIRPSSSSVYSSPAVPSESVDSLALVSSQTTSVIATSQTGYASLSPSSSANSRPLAMATTVLTTASVGISPTTSISLLSTERRPPPSSSEAVFTERPPVYENETVIVVFEGDCNDIANDVKAKENFRKKVVEEVANDLRIDKSYIHVSDVQCGSILVTLTVIGASGKANVSHELKKLVENGSITVTFNGKSYTAKKIQQVQPPATQPPTTKAPKSEVAFILYITFGALIALIFIVGIIVLVIRCRKDSRQGSFFLTADTNYELRRFQGIPRVRNYSRVNYYGDPVELDAAAADPDTTSHEFQAKPHSFNKGPSLDRVKPIAAANGEEKFNVGAGLPEWKNLPMLSKSEVARASDPKKGIPPSSGSVGSRNQLLAHESETPQEDSKLAFDNPVVTIEEGTSESEKDVDNKPNISTFGDSASGQENEMSVEKAYDNHGLTEDDSL